MNGYRLDEYRSDAAAGGGRGRAVESGIRQIPASATDPGAGALAFALKLLGVPADAAEICHQSGKTQLGEVELLRAARRFPVKARALKSSHKRLLRTPLPALAAL